MGRDKGRGRGRAISGQSWEKSRGGQEVESEHVQGKGKSKRRKGKTQRRWRQEVGKDNDMVTSARSG